MFCFCLLNLTKTGHVALCIRTRQNVPEVPTSSVRNGSVISGREARSSVSPDPLRPIVYYEFLQGHAARTSAPTSPSHSKRTSFTMPQCHSAVVDDLHNVLKAKPILVSSQRLSGVTLRPPSTTVTTLDVVKSSQHGDRTSCATLTRHADQHRVVAAYSATWKHLSHEHGD